MSHLDLDQHRTILSPESKQKFYEAFIALMGESLNLLKQPYLVRMLSNAGLRKGRAYTLKKLTKFAEPQGKYPDFINAVQTLLAQNVLMRGYVLKCEACDTEDWYEFNTVYDPMPCRECQTETPLSLELEFKYRLNKIARNALNQGGLSVILTMLWLKQQYGEGIPCQLSLKADKTGEHFDIDLLADISTGRIFAECKDNFKDEDIPDIITQIAHLKQLSDRKLENHVLFATLRSDIPAALTSIENIRCLTLHNLLA